MSSATTTRKGRGPARSGRGTYTAADVAGMLGVTPRTLYRRCRMRPSRFPAPLSTTEHPWRWPAAWVDHYLATGRWPEGVRWLHKP